MKEEHLQNSDNIVRYIKPRMIKNNQVVGEAFCLRSSRSDEKGLSVNWLEFFGGNKEHQLDQARSKCRLERSKNGRFAELNVSETRNIHSEELLEKLNLQIIQDPLEKDDNFEADPSHALIIGLPQGGTRESRIVGDLIARRINELHSAY